MLGDRPWFQLLDPLEVTRGLFRTFATAPATSVHNAVGCSASSASDGLRRVAFQRMLSASAVVAYMERPGPRRQGFAAAAAAAAMAAHAAHDPPPLTRAEELAANQRVKTNKN